MFLQYKDAFMKANPGYKWCPATSKPVKSPSGPPVSNPRKKVWSFSSNSTKDSPTAKKVPKTDSMPQLNFAMAGVYDKILFVQWPSHNILDGSLTSVVLSDPTKMGGLSMLLLAGEHALTNREVGPPWVHPYNALKSDQSLMLFYLYMCVNNVFLFQCVTNPSIVFHCRSLPALNPGHLTQPAKGTPFQGTRKRCVLRTCYISTLYILHLILDAVMSLLSSSLIWFDDTENCAKQKTRCIHHQHNT